MKKLFSLLLAVLFAFTPAFAKVKVHTIGDSTMADYEEGTSDKRGWCQYLQTFFDASQVEINNRGKSGADTRGFYNTLWASVKSQMTAGDYVLIQFAHNDEGTVTYGTDNLELAAYNAANGLPALSDARGTCPYSTYRDMLRTYIKEAREMNVTPILVAPICRKYFNGNTIRRNGQHDLGDKFWKLENGVLLKDQTLPATDHTMDYVEAMQIVAAEMKVPFINMTEATRNLYETLGEATCTSTLFCEGDNTHLQAGGAIQVGRLGAQMLKDNIPALAPYITIPTSLAASPASIAVGETYSGITQEKEILLTGTGLEPANGVIIITTSSNLQVSTDKSTYDATANIAYNGSTIFQRVYVRAKYKTSGVQNDSVVFTMGDQRIVVPVTATVISLEGGTTVSATWAIAGKTNATDVVTVGPATAAMTMVNMMAADTKSDFVDGESKITMVRLHNSDATGAKIAWPANEIDENTSRYVDFALTAPNNAEIRVTSISMKMASYSTAVMCLHVNTGIGDNMSGVTTICEKKNMANMSVYTETFHPTITIPAGDVLHVRVLPWHDNASGSGKYIALKDVVIEGMAFETAPVTKYTITYNNGGHGATIAASESLTLPNPLPTLSEEGWIFDGWFAESAFNTAITAGGKLTQDTTLYAKWTERQKFAVTFNMNGHGTQIDPLNVYELPTLPTPAEDGWRFDGWFTDADFTTPAAKGAAVTTATTLYAKWTEIQKPQGEFKEELLYFTNFQNWDAVSSSTSATTKTVTTNKSKESLTFTFAETQIAPTGTNDKFTNTEVITPGYAMAAKTATPYIETSVLASVTKVSYVHAATGSSRGWGMKVKGDGDADWVTLNSTYCASAGTLVSVDVNRTNCQIRFYNLNAAQNAYMTELAIYGNVEVLPRSFTDFKIDFRTNPYTVLAPATGLPAGVILTGTDKINGAQHGLAQGATITVPVDGPVRFTIGACNHNGSDVTITNHTGAEIATINAKMACENSVSDITKATYASFATWTYNVEEPDTLTFRFTKAYLPYFFAEACEYVANVKVTYFDQNGNRLGEKELAPGLPFEPAYTVADLPAIPDGKAFRGWYSNVGEKAPAVINTDIKLYALVTDIETPTVGSHYIYNLTKPTFYMEDHELISATGSYKNEHGWGFSNGQNIKLIVSPKSYVIIGLCTYTNTSDQTITNRAGEVVGTMHVIKNGEANATPDGATYSFYNESSDIDTLTFNFTTTSYIHSVEVYNVAAPLNKKGHVYDIASGDAATLMMVCPQLQDGDTIQLHDGIYDLGETVLTTISASHVVVRGESMTGTIIKNAPAAETESIDKTATIVNTGVGNVYEHLTLQNALDYYKANNGRAVALWDKGDRTACYSVRLLSYQDTYYSNKPGQQCWFEDCEIHGTVDFICGSGSVYFYNTLLYCEKRQSNGGGADCITANNSQTGRSDKGYVFDRCTVRSECPTVSLGRAWNDQPMVAYLLTTFDMSEGNFTVNDGSKVLRWTLEAMNTALPQSFVEYATMDVDGKVISPETNTIRFYINAGKGSGEKTMNTIIDYTEAEAKSYTHFFRDGWTPARNYIAFPAPKPTALMNVTTESHSRKVMQNGQLIILRGNKAYNAQGQMMK